MSECLTAEVIARYTEGRCSAEEFDAVEKHLSECQACRSRMQSGGSFLQDGTATIIPNSDSETISQPAHSADQMATKTTHGPSDTAGSTSSQAEIVSTVFENYKVVE